MILHFFLHMQNVTINSTLNVTLSQSSPLDYTVVFSSVEILHIGANLHSSSVSVGDSSSSPHILLSNVSSDVNKLEILCINC